MLHRSDPEYTKPSDPAVGWLFARWSDDGRNFPPDQDVIMWRFSPAGMQYSREPDKLPRVIEEIDRKVEILLRKVCVLVTRVFG